MSKPLRESLDQLLALQKIDTDVDRATRRRAALDAGGSREAAAKAAMDEAGAARRKLSEIDRSIKDAELEQGGIETKIKNYEQRMRSGQLTNAREIANVERELGQLHRQRAVLDDKLLNLMEESEATRTQSAELEERSRQLDQEYATHKQLYRTNMDSLAAEIVHLQELRADAAAAVSDKALLQRYEGIRARPTSGGIGIARIEEMHCGACHQQVSQQDDDHVHAGDEIVTCENCRRILA